MVFEAFFPTFGLRSGGGSQRVVPTPVVHVGRCGLVGEEWAFDHHRVEWAWCVKRNADGYFFAGNPQYCTITGFNGASYHRNVYFRSCILKSVLQNLFKFIVYFKKFMRVTFRAVDVKPLMKRQPALKPTAPIGNACQNAPWRSIRVRRWQVKFVLCVPRESQETRSANARDPDLSKECS